MKVFDIKILKNVYFGLVMRLTSLLPEVLPILKLRGCLLKPCFERCGANLQVTRDVRIAHTHNVSIGNDVFVSGGCWILASDKITIEDEVMLGPYSILVTGDHTLYENSYRFGEARRAPIRLQRGSWVGAHAIVCKGVTLGKGSVIAAGSVALNDVPDLCVVGGVPGRIVKNYLA